MLAYPITLEPDDGTLLATSPDFPELTTFGNDPKEAFARAIHALEEAIAARIHDRREVPMPSGGDTSTPNPMLYLVPYDQLLHGRAGEERQRIRCLPARSARLRGGRRHAGRDEGSHN